MCIPFDYIFNTLNIKYRTFNKHFLSSYEKYCFPANLRIIKTKKKQYNNFKFIFFDIQKKRRRREKKRD